MFGRRVFLVFRIGVYGKIEGSMIMILGLAFGHFEIPRGKLGLKQSLLLLFIRLITIHIAFLDSGGHLRLYGGCDWEVGRHGRSLSGRTRGHVCSVVLTILDGCNVRRELPFGSNLLSVDPYQTVWVGWNLVCELHDYRCSTSTVSSSSSLRLLPATTRV